MILQLAFYPFDKKKTFICQQINLAASGLAPIESTMQFVQIQSSIRILLLVISRFGRIIQFAFHAPHTEATRQFLLRWPRIVAVAAAATTAIIAAIQFGIIVVRSRMACGRSIATAATTECIQHTGLIGRYHFVEEVDVAAKE